MEIFPVGSQTDSNGPMMPRGSKGGGVSLKSQICCKKEDEEEECLTLDSHPGNVADVRLSKALHPQTASVECLVFR